MEVALLGTFSVRVGGEVVDSLSSGSQRLLVFLALHDRAVDRIAMAGTMWPESTDHRAGASLRSALSRLDARLHDSIVTKAGGISLAGSVAVDFRHAQGIARRLLGPDDSPTEGDLGSAALAALSKDLLPDWYDDWVVEEAEDWRRLRVSALEAMARLLTAGGRLPGAAGAARAAMRVEPLRESAHASLIRVHMAEGNQSEALRVFDCYRTMLYRELGLEPTELLSELVVSLQKHSDLPV